MAQRSLVWLLAVLLLCVGCALSGASEQALQDSAPAAAESEAPTFQPTFVPTFAPTLSPVTEQPPQATTVSSSPSLAPVASVAAETSSAPSAAPTVAAAETTSAPSWSMHPSQQPVTLPTMAPTSAQTQVAYLYLYASLTIDGCKEAAFNANLTTNQAVVTAALLKAFDNKLTAGDLSFQSAAARIDPESEIEFLVVKFYVIADFKQLGFKSAGDAFKALSTELAAYVNDKKMSATLQDEAKKQSAAALLHAVAVSVTASSTNKLEPKPAPVTPPGGLTQLQMVLFVAIAVVVTVSVLYFMHACCCNEGPDPSVLLANLPRNLPGAGGIGGKRNNKYSAVNQGDEEDDDETIDL